VVRAEASARLRLRQLDPASTIAARRYTLLDVFTSTRLQGNPLAVVHDADDVSDAVMHTFARETRLSETSYVQSPSTAGADYRNRIWTTGGEIPFAGHPSLGTAAAVARAQSESSITYTQETGAGRQPIDVEVAEGVTHVSMLQEPAAFGAELDPAEVLAAAGLDAGDAHPELPCQAVSTGLWHVIAPVRDAAALERVRPDHDRIAALLAPHGAICLYLAHPQPETLTASARSFFGRAEAGEDPATGSAAGPLCAYLADRAGMLRITVTQGVEMGRASRLVTQLEGDRVRVGGDAVVVLDGTVFLDG
jgi:trans-2,3-dihydro-3-hydroxyanthranilate isomerase